MNRIPGPAQGAAADDWSRRTAKDMIADGYVPSAILDKLTAYGLSLYAAQALLREFMH